MAGMGEALSLMLAGGVENAAGNRATDLREEEKAQVAAAREQQLALFKEQLKQQTNVQKEGLTRETNRQQNEWRGGENQKDRDSRMSIATMQEAGANSRNAATIAGADRRAEMAAGGVDAKTGKRLQGTASWFKDENGNPTFGVKTFKDGSQELVYPDEIPGYRGTSAEINDALGQAEKFANEVVSEKSKFFTPDSTVFAEYGGSRTAAKDGIKAKWLADHGYDNNGRLLQASGGKDPSGGEEPPKPQKGQPQQQQKQTDGAQEDITSGMNAQQAELFNKAKAARPDLTEEQLLQALLRNKKYADVFAK